MSFLENSMEHAKAHRTVSVDAARRARMLIRKRVSAQTS